MHSVLLMKFSIKECEQGITMYQEILETLEMKRMKELLEMAELGLYKKMKEEESGSVKKIDDPESKQLWMKKALALEESTEKAVALLPRFEKKP